MAFSLFKKQQKKDDAPSDANKQKSTLVPIGQEEKSVPHEEKLPVLPQQRTWRMFPVGSDAVLKQPSLTEKAIRLNSVGKYVFEVNKDANKLSIRKAFFNAYGVMPSSVAVIRKEGKTVRHGRIVGHRRSVKKAIITVPKGKSVDLGI